MLSAYFTLTLVILHYFIDYHQQRNSVDRAFLRFIVPKKWTIGTEVVSQRWTRALEAAVLFLGDTQVVTSVSILLSGYVQLPCGLSTYHWEIIVDLAWFSALTHLAALTSLRHYFRRRPAMAVWRVLFMGITLVLLSSAFYPTGYVPQNFAEFDGYHYILNAQGLNHTAQEMNHFLSSPAVCLMNGQRRSELTENLAPASNVSDVESKIKLPFNVALTSMSLTYLMISYVIRIIRLSHSAAETATKWLRIKPVDCICDAYGSARRRSFRPRVLSSMWKGLLLICITMSEAMYEIGNSMLWEISWLAAALIWGTFRLIQHRNHSYLFGENTWGFGQVLAVSLSALPTWMLVTNLQETPHTSFRVDTDVMAMRVVHGLGRLDQHSWFNGLVGFIFGTALTIVGGTIYAFSGSTLFSPGTSEGSDALYQAPGWIAIIYIAAISCSTVAAGLYTALALSIHYWLVSSCKLSAWWRHQTINLSRSAQQRLRAWTWVLFIMLLVGAQLVLYLRVFFWSSSNITWSNSGTNITGHFISKRNWRR